MVFDFHGRVVLPEGVNQVFGPVEKTGGFTDVVFVVLFGIIDGTAYGFSNRKAVCGFSSVATEEPLFAVVLKRFSCIDVLVCFSDNFTFDIGSHGGFLSGMELMGDYSERILSVGNIHLCELDSVDACIFEGNHEGFVEDCVDGQVFVFNYGCTLLFLEIGSYRNCVV